MNRSIFFLVIIAALCVIMPGCNPKIAATSPNGKIKAELSQSPDGKSCQMQVTYVDCNGNTVQAATIPSLGLTINDTVAHSFQLGDLESLSVQIDNYEMLTGKKRNCHNEATQCIYTLADQSTSSVMRLELRVYNNGVAFRYILDGDLVLGPESTSFYIPDGANRWISPWDWNKAYESFFPLSSKTANGHYQFPFLVEATANCFALYTEAGISSCHSAASLYNNGADSVLAVCPDENKLTHHGYTSPWRVIMIGELADIVESTLVTDLSPETELEDISWIKPGVASWIYWAYNHGSNDYKIVTQYIDMAAKYKLPYVLIDAEWDEMKNGGNIEDAIKYAKSLGVDCLIWYNSSTAWVSHGAPGPFYRLNKLEDREKEFAWLQQMGVKGVKIDFFPGDPQETMAYCIDLLESAAKYHLMVNFHGATIPRGWQRTYPNLMSTEAVRGAEWYNNGPQFTEPAASHNATLPFTRNVVGSMDYTPCTFSDSQFPHITSNAHELALTVIFESGIQHLADKPESYYAQPQEVQDFLSALPSTWDDTKLLAGYPGQFCLMARKNGSKWYIGCINGTSEEKLVDLNLQKLGSLSKYTVFEDGDSETSPWKISAQQPAGSIKCKARGGFVIVAE